MSKVEAGGGRRTSQCSNVMVAVMVGKTGMVKRTGKPAPAGNLLSKKARKFSAWRPVRAMTSATGTKLATCREVGDTTVWWRGDIAA